jgi:hypothetical protein
MSSESTIRDRFEIADLLAQFARGCDNNDLALVSACFTPDATLNYEALPASARSVRGFVEHVALVLSQLQSTQHLLGNIVVDVRGDRARSLSYVQATAFAPNGQSWAIGGEYADELVRTADGWRIAHRTHRRHFARDADGLQASVSPAG